MGSMSRANWQVTLRTVSGFWWLVAPMVSKLPCTARCWRPVGTRSRCSPVVWTAPTRAGTVTCWTGWVMWVRWSANFRPDQCRHGIGSWPAPDCWRPCQRRRWSWRPAHGRGHCEWRPKPTSSVARLVRCRGRSPASPVMVRTSCSAPATHAWSTPLPTSKNSPPTARPVACGCRPSSHGARGRRLVRPSDLCSPVGSLRGSRTIPLDGARPRSSLCPAITGRGAASPGRRAADAHHRWSGGSASVVLFQPGRARSSAPCPPAGRRVGPGR